MSDPGLDFVEAVPCEHCGHDAREHQADEGPFEVGVHGCLHGWGREAPWRAGVGCRCEGFSFAGATDLSDVEAETSAGS